ncbi:MAG TPA: phosphoribosylamine--glycine ligase [Terriglobales bacterium]|nr:phosphoribosylamine--glycine ligase [Terriglobales bacterium]
MKVLVLGSGGREHALVWKLRQSPRVEKVYCVPGNGGIAADAECLPGDLKNLDHLLTTAARIQPDLTVVGPELPLNLGVVDEFSRRGLRIFGPTAAAARLESSKAFAKEFMQRHNIPTAKYAVCSSQVDLRDALPHFSPPIVVKADGLAAGKGVVICKSKDEAGGVAGEMLSGKILDGAGKRLVLEEFLEGEELSFMVLSDGERLAPLVAAQDYKRVGDGDTGPNTGGMGSYSADGLVAHEMQEWLLTHIARPAIAGMKAEDSAYKGILYCGLMMTARGPQVLEFNCRFGDPETQPVLMRMESDVLGACIASIEGRVSEGDLKWSRDAAVCVVLASAGYPGPCETGKKIAGIEEANSLEGVKVFHAGTLRRDDGFYTAGGRVLGVTARGADLAQAVERAYAGVARIHFEGMHYRKDIAARALRSSPAR